jgi:hypothetical protein
MPLLWVVTLDKGTTMPGSHALIKGILEALNLTYLVAGLIAPI